MNVNRNAAHLPPQVGTRMTRHLTRSTLIGHAFRIQKTYGISALGVQVMCAWHRAVGDRSILEMVLPRTVGMAPFENIHGERVVMSRKRIARLRRKLAEVRLRGATYREGCLTRRQAA